jgi:hypothetical protein
MTKSNERKELNGLLDAAEGHVMSNSERRAQAISFTYGQLALMSEYKDASKDELQALRDMCTATVDKMHPEWLQEESDDDHR